jgi:hypothetical protein
MNPEQLLEEAIAEAVHPRTPLTVHLQTIVVLHEQKRMTYRAIANWFVSRGIGVNHSMVFRAYQAALKLKLSTRVQEPARVVSVKGSKNKQRKKICQD